MKIIANQKFSSKEVEEIKNEVLKNVNVGTIRKNEISIETTKNLIVGNYLNDLFDIEFLITKISEKTKTPPKKAAKKPAAKKTATKKKS